MSRVAHHKLGGYAALPDWTDDPTDVSLRESDVSLILSYPHSSFFPDIQLDDPVPVSALASMSISSAATASAVPRALSSANSPAASSPAGSLPHTTTARTAFRDLDDFLNSDESEEATESESEEEPYAVRTSAPAVGGRGFVSEYEEGDEDEDESEEDDDEEEEEEETDEEEGTDDEGEDEDERARLYR
jgi:hypothetical protein